MADIDIQEKQGPGIWPWLIGALALVLVIWAVVEFTGDGTDRGTAVPAAEQAPAETYPPAGTYPLEGETGGAADPYSPMGPSAPGAEPAAPGTDPAIGPAGTQPETPGMTRDQPPTGAGQPDGVRQ